MAAFGEVNLLFNNAGVGAGGLVWENSERDWEWVLGSTCTASSTACASSRR